MEDQGMFNVPKDLSGAAVRGEAVAGTIYVSDMPVEQLVIVSNSVRPVFTIKVDGSLEFGEHVTPRDAALAIQEAFANLPAPGSAHAADAPSEPILRKLTEELTLNEIATEFFACANMGWDCTMSAGACRKLFDAMTKGVAADAPSEPSEVLARDAKWDGFDNSELGQAQSIAWTIWRDNYREDAPDFCILSNLKGVLSQIDNMVCGLSRAADALDSQPTARPTDDELWDATLRDRDTYHEWADKLADAIAAHFGVDIGEHSNINLPWAEALEAIETADWIEASSQSAASASQESIGDDAQFAQMMRMRTGLDTEGKTFKDIVAYIDSRAPAAQAASAPDGWKLVPIDPTPRMLDAARNAGLPAVLIDSITGCVNLRITTEYRAMLYAAPQQEGSEAGK